MNIRLCAVALVGAGLIAGMSFAADPSGTWRWEHPNESGEMIPDVLKLTLQDGKVSGSYVSPDGELPIENASMEGDTLRWEINIDAGGRQCVHQGFPSRGWHGNAIAKALSVHCPASLSRSAEGGGGILWRV